MVTGGLAIAAFGGIAIAAGVAGYLAGRYIGRRSERRRWERRMVGEAQALGRTRLMIRRALEKGSQPKASNP
jgi:hypothetical protein